MERILLLLAAERGGDAAEAVLQALAGAESPESLSVGVLTDGPEELPDAPGLAALRTAPFGDPWKTGMDLWQGETWVLLGAPEMRFVPKWDRALLREADFWKERSANGPAVTGCLPAESDPVCAVSPVAAKGFDGEGRLIQAPGVPLRYARRGEPGALVHPRFCFARAAFFRDCAGSDADPFWVAFRGRRAVITLGQPVLRLTRDEPLPAVSAPADDPEGRSRFARHFGIDFDRRTVTARAMEGVWNADLSAPARVPLRVRLQERLRSLDNVASRLTPLAVTCRMAEEDPAAAEIALRRFRRLASLRHVPLLCFADRAERAQTERLCANTLLYEAKYALPTAVPLRPGDRQAYMRLSVPFLLAAARERDEDHSHYVWLDPDILRWPVWERAAVDWQVICGDRVTLAAVDGRPDLAAVSVPESRVLSLCRGMKRVCDGFSRETGRLPDMADMWEALIAEDPDGFDLIDLPRPGELFTLTMATRDEEW